MRRRVPSVMEPSEIEVVVMEMVMMIRVKKGGVFHTQARWSACFQGVW